MICPGDTGDDSGLLPVNTVCTGLKRSSYYTIEVSVFKGNPVHKAILYTGFDNGAYREIWNASYEAPIARDGIGQCRIRVLGEITLLNERQDNK